MRGHTNHYVLPDTAMPHYIFLSGSNFEDLPLCFLLPSSAKFCHTREEAIALYFLAEKPSTAW